ncbi:tail fiber domain-containing protein, partial [Candidatus Magnetobacterium casensis]|nr:tail fiber domain-containing protein [Candidatus Magnetobacterium casensis]
MRYITVGGTTHDSTGQQGFIGYNRSDKQWQIGTHYQSASMIIRSMEYGGYVGIGIGTTTPAYPLHMASGAYVTTGGVWTNASSRKYKKDIQSLTSEDAMLAFNKLEPVSFRYKTDDEQHIGFIADDVPDLVASKDRKGLSTMDVVALLTKVVQEQQKIAQEQQKTIAELKE